MEIKEIVKLNIQDGDIIGLPHTSWNSAQNLSKQIQQVFPEKKFIVIWDEDGSILGIKVLHLTGISKPEATPRPDGAQY